MDRFYKVTPHSFGLVPELWGLFYPERLDGQEVFCNLPSNNKKNLHRIVNQ